MSDPCPSRSFLDTDGCDDEARQAYNEITQRLGLDRVVTLAFAGITNAAEAEAQFKQARKAHHLGVRGSAKAYTQAAEAYHCRSLDQIAAAIEAVKASRRLFASSEDEQTERIRKGYAEEFTTFLKTELVPDFRLRLLESDMAPTEAQIAYDTLRQPVSATYDNELGRLQHALVELHELRSSDDRGLRVDEASGVTVWKKVAIVVGFILVRILIAICKWWNFIVCFIVEYVWRLVRRRVIRWVLRRCRDPRPIPNPT